MDRLIFTPCNQNLYAWAQAKIWPLRSVRKQILPVCPNRSRPKISGDWYIMALNMTKILLLELPSDNVGFECPQGFLKVRSVVHHSFNACRIVVTAFKSRNQIACWWRQRRNVRFITNSFKFRAFAFQNTNLIHCVWNSQYSENKWANLAHSVLNVA